MSATLFLDPLCAVSRGNRRLNTLASVPRSLPLSRCLQSSSGVVLCMTALTWTRGWTTISTEGGPERKLYGP
jgi:hypothetical protein